MGYRRNRRTGRGRRLRSTCWQPGSTGPAAAPSDVRCHQQHRCVAFIGPSGRPAGAGHRRIRRRGPARCAAGRAGRRSRDRRSRRARPRRRAARAGRGRGGRRIGTGQRARVRCVGQRRRRRTADRSLRPGCRRRFGAINRYGLQPARPRSTSRKRAGRRKRLEPFTVRTPFGPDLRATWSSCWPPASLTRKSAGEVPGNRSPMPRRPCSAARSPARRCWTSSVKGDESASSSLPVCQVGRAREERCSERRRPDPPHHHDLRGR